jgi:hypothetical protein
MSERSSLVKGSLVVGADLSFTSGFRVVESRLTSSTRTRFVSSAERQVLADRLAHRDQRDPRALRAMPAPQAWLELREQQVRKVWPDLRELQVQQVPQA